MPNYPTSLDALANPTSTTLRNDPGFSLAAAVSTLNDIAEAVEAKVGIGASVPGATAAVLRRTATGTSAWGQVAAGDIAVGQAPALIQSSGVLAAPQAFIAFTGIPQAYTSLELRIYGVSTAAVAVDNVRLLINATSTASYYHQAMYAAAGTPSAVEQLGITFGFIGAIPGANATPAAGWMGLLTAVLHGYATATKVKAVVSTGYAGYGTATGTQQAAINGMTLTGSVAPVTQIQVQPSGGSWGAGTIAALYGYP